MKQHPTEVGVLIEDPETQESGVPPRTRPYALPAMHVQTRGPMPQPERYMVLLDYPDGTRDAARDAEQGDMPWVSTNRLSVEEAAREWQQELGATCRVRVVRLTDCRRTIGDGGLTIDVEAGAVVGVANV